MTFPLTPIGPGNDNSCALQSAIYFTLTNGVAYLNAVDVAGRGVRSNCTSTT